MKVEPRRKGLGKGLGALIRETPGADPLQGPVGASAEAPAPVAAGVPLEVPVEKIHPNPHQPRQRFDEAEIDALAESIKQSGILQPLVLRPETDGRYTLVAGERRLRAAKRVGLAVVPAVIGEYADDKLLELALIENIQRDDLGPLETARAFRKLVRELGLTQAEVAERVGKPRSSVANFLRLLDLPDVVQNLLDDGTLDMGHGRALAGLENPELQEKLALAAATNGWSVREVEARAKRAQVEGTVADDAADDRRDPNVAAAEKTLARALEAGVSISIKRNGKGKIEIRFANGEDLDRLYRALLRGSGKAGA
ncbi:ParB/RepB/Spo0J family partition protein [bacterium]|nr:ParB/RepB/Spo0J family partition protein [bacterium]